MFQKKKFAFFTNSLIFYYGFKKQPVLDFIAEKILGEGKKGNELTNLTEISEKWKIMILKTDNNKKIETLLKNLGTEIDKGFPFLASTYNEKINLSNIDKLILTLKYRIKDDILDLSKFNLTEFPQIKLSDNLTASLILFLCAVSSLNKHLLDQITKIDISNNEISSLDFLLQSRLYFPNLLYILITDTPIIYDKRKLFMIKESFKLKGIDIFDDKSNNNNPFFNNLNNFLISDAILMKDAEWDNNEPISSKKKLKVFIPNFNEEKINDSLENYQSIDIENLSHPFFNFINEYLLISKLNLIDLFHFYAPTSILSILCENCSENSNLNFYKINSRNLKKNDGQIINFIYGKDNIINTLIYLFGNKWNFCNLHYH